MINTSEFARRHFGMFVSRWNQTQVHSEGGPLIARCPRHARWVLGDRNFVQKEVDPSTCNCGTLSEVLSRGFSAHCRLLIPFSRAHTGSFPPGLMAHAVTPYRTPVLK